MTEAKLRIHVSIATCLFGWLDRPDGAATGVGRHFRTRNFLESSLSPNMGNPNPDDEYMSPDEIRAELKRINKTLKLSAIRKHEPYKCLPYQYLPIPDIDHRPPLFMYGLALNFEEIDEYVLRPETPILPEMTRAYGMDLLSTFVMHLRELFGLEDLERSVFPHLADCDDRLVFQFMTNYDRRGVSEEKVVEVIAICERLFHRPPMWYLSPLVEPKKDYRIPESKYFG
ncbi:hypothetical protein BD779DRAFT_768299 [Infundibulicybe gibba]|nr:hypothetical protein BD779DRAFT_768299 [Infundibulicybe gibba]